MRVFGSVITAAIIGGGGALLASVAALDGHMPNGLTWVVAVVVGAISAAKDYRSLMQLPPVDTTPSVGPPPFPR